MEKLKNNEKKKTYFRRNFPFSGKLNWIKYCIGENGKGKNERVEGVGGGMERVARKQEASILRKLFLIQFL